MKINIAIKDGIKEVDCHVFSIVGFDEKFAVHFDQICDIDGGNLYSITELSTGMKVIGECKNKREAIRKAKERLAINKNLWPDVKIKAIAMLEENQIYFPLNIL